MDKCADEIEADVLSPESERAQALVNRFDLDRLSVSPEIKIGSHLTWNILLNDIIYLLVSTGYGLP